jgi:hypothetical protein
MNGSCGRVFSEHRLRECQNGASYGHHDHARDLLSRGYLKTSSFVVYLWFPVCSVADGARTRICVTQAYITMTMKLHVSADYLGSE